MITDEGESYRDVLPSGFELHWYELKSILGRGAFGVTYLAQDKNLDQLVAIKEYFPNEFSMRESGCTVHPTTNKNREMYEWGLSRFIREARTLAKFKHPNIVRVLSVFENNNTAYMVMEYEHGKELSRLFKEKKHFTEQELLDIFLPVVEGLRLVHDAGFIHRDIKPSNIYIRADNSPVLIDFGSARQVAGAPTRVLTSLITYGYAPFEQYNESEDKQGPWTDIYALGASLFFGLTNKLPIEPLARGSSMLSTGIDPYQPLSVTLEGKYSASFLRTIDHALSFHAHERPQDVITWASMLRGEREVPELPAARLESVHKASAQDATVIHVRKPVAPSTCPPTHTTSQPTTHTANTRLIPTLFVVGIALAAGTALLLMPGMQDPEKNRLTAQEQQAAAKIEMLLTQADQAYRSGDYIEPEEHNALQLYLQLLALEPAHEQANIGIEKIIQRFSNSVQNDLAEGYFDTAEKDLQRLLAARPDSKKLIELQSELKVAQIVHTRQIQLLAQADQYLEQNSLLSPIGNNALSTLRRVLEFNPDNKGAIQRIDTIAAHYVTQANKQITAGKFSAAHKSIRNIKLVDDNHPEITPLTNLLVHAKEEDKQQQLAGSLWLAKEAIKENRLLYPPQKNALYLYQKSLEMDSENTTAKKGIERVKTRLKIELDGYLENREYSQAESLLASIEKNLPGSTFAKSVRAEWNNKSPAPESEIQTIERVIGHFKQAFESHNRHALSQMSEPPSTRKGFIDQLFSNYRSFKLNISNIRFIGKKNAAQADIEIRQLINRQGLPVQPGAWSQFEINIKKNNAGQWKIYW